MLSACDKLHKLYSTTAEPIVWARSTGLEILNELDTLKGALMMTAGTNSGRTAAGHVGWQLAAQGVEGLAKGVDSMRALANGVAGMVGATARQLWQQGSSPPSRT